MAAFAVTEDIYRAVFRQPAVPQNPVNTGRITVLLTALAAMWLAMKYEQNVLALVAYAWAGFGAAFGPALLLILYWKGCTPPGSSPGD